MIRNFISNQVLSSCNRIRRHYGISQLQDMPLGSKGENHNCPVANALNTNLENIHDSLPTQEIIYITLFILLFDLGLMPQYDVNLPKDKRNLRQKIIKTALPVTAIAVTTGAKMLERHYRRPIKTRLQHRLSIH